MGRQSARQRVVRHHHGRHGILFAQSKQEFEGLGRFISIERRKRLIEQKELGILTKSTGQGGALALSAAQRLRIAGAKISQLERLYNMSLRRFRAHASTKQPGQHYVGANGLPRQESVALLHVGDSEMLIIGGVSTDDDASRCSWQQAGQGIEQRRLADAGRTIDLQKLALCQRERKMGYDRRIFSRPTAGRRPIDSQIGDGEKGSGRRHGFVR